MGFWLSSGLSWGFELGVNLRSVDEVVCEEDWIRACGRLERRS